MLLGRFYTFLCKLFYISRPRLPPWAVYFILMPWASVLGFGPGLRPRALLRFKVGLTRAVYGFFIFSPTYARGVQVSSGLRPHARGIFKFFQVLRLCVGLHSAISGPFLMGCFSLGCHA